MTPVGAIVLVAVCLVLQGTFSGSEIALVSADRLRLAEGKERGDIGAALALHLLDHEDRLLGTCLIGTNLCVITGTTLVSWLLARHGLDEEWLVALTYVPIALVLGEALPKTVYQHHATTAAPYVARFVRLFQVVFTPFLLVVAAWAGVLSRLTGTSGERSVLTRQELLLLLQAPEAGEIDPEEHRMIQRVFEITERVVEECMTPLVEVEALPIEATIKEAAEVALRNGHTRIPVYEERVDHIVGVVHAQDLLFESRDGEVVRSVLRPVKYVPETKRVDALLNEMRREREHFAVIVDEYGGSVGIVTIEDLLEEIIGEIRDERDEDELAIKRIGPEEWRVEARVEIEALAQAIGRELPEGEYETVAGLLLARIGRIPRKAETVRVGDLVFRVEEANERAIQLVTLKVVTEPPRPVASSARKRP